MPILNAINKIFGDPNERALKPYREAVPEINALEPEMQALSNEELRAKTDEFRERLDEGETLDDILPEAFAVVRETARRVIGMRHFDVQLIGGMVLHDGKIAEMRTGEGKTLVATLPAYLNALTGEGVHIVTVNDYLAKRDAGWMGRVYHALGLSVGCLQNQVSWVFDPLAEQPSEDGAGEGDGSDGADSDEPQQEREPFRMATKQQAYVTDITFGTNHEFGFDYLRDNMVDDLSHKVQGKLKFAIVDEVDNILIDEARTPLIISGPARDSAQEYQRFAQLARRMKPEEDFTIDERHQAISLTQEGIDKVESFLRVDNLYDPENYSLTHFVENALRAEFLYLRDKQYVVREGEVIIVDEFTGRLMHGRRYSEGLHQAIEAKEGVKVQRESITYATITLQNYFRMYEKLSGMTGTAATEGEEFYKIYKLEVVVIPTDKPTARYDRGDYIYKTEAGKLSAVVGAVEEAHAQDRPVLIGTTSVERSEELSKMLDGRGIKHEVLNAKNHAREATIIAQAGRPGAVTVSTNMAGRGTDIILGGNPEQLGISDEEWQRDHDRVIEQGGLLVIGTARHESRRIDNQLRGRAGRQGDPGETRFFVSTEDDIVRRFGGERIRGVMNFAGIEDDYPMENKMVSRAIENAQSKVEGINFEIRKQLVDYDDVVNTQRDMIYRLRQRILAGEEIREEIMERVRKAVSSLVHGRLTGDPEDWDVSSFANEVRTLFELPDEFEDPEAIIDHDPDEVEQILLAHADRLYDQYEEALGEDLVRKGMQAVFLRAIDSQWVEHLTAMENMRQGIGLQ
ncbi:MAG: preprotein translocase subunit SecA, partial [Chloroflexota bacterium]